MTRLRIFRRLISSRVARWIAAALLLMLLQSCAFPSAAQRIRCYAPLIRLNETELLAAAKQGSTSLPEVDRIAAWGNAAVFSMDAFGLVPSGTEWGFYFSPEDEPLPIPFAQDTPLAPSGEDWAYAEYGDNRGYTQRIRPCWYYFSAHW